MKGNCLILLLSLVCFSVATTAQYDLPAEISDTNTNATINIKNNLLTLLVKKQSLTDTLNLISKHHKIKFIVSGKLDSDVYDWSIMNTPIDNAIHMLLKNYNIIMYYEFDVTNKMNQLSSVEILASDKINTSTSNSSISKNMIDNDKNYRQVDNLQGLNDPITVALLINNIKNNINPEARIRAAQLLEDIGTAESKLAVESALGDKNVSVRLLTLNLLSKRHNEQSVLLLGQIINNDPDTEMRLLALKKLSEFNSSSAKTIIQSALQDNDKLVRNMALKLSQQ